MLTLRRLPRAYASLSGARGNASLQAASSTADAVTPPPPSPPKVTAQKVTPTPTASKAKTPDASAASEDAGAQKEKPKVWTGPTRRPRISLDHPKEWNRPIARGVLPVYDLALAYVREDAAQIKDELKALQKELKVAMSAPEGERDTQKVEELTEKAAILEIQSQINLPEVRWKAANGMGDMKELVYRHLIEKRWREEGALDLLMERIHQMNVVPDLLPSLHPSFDLRLNFPESPPEDPVLRARTKRRYKKVEPGIFLLPEQTWRPPVLYTTVFHTDTRLYTLLMVDLDVPKPETHSYQTYLHWLQPNLALSAFSPSPIPLATSHTRYIPPHPQRGTPYHRYVILLLPQASSTEPISVPVISDAERLGFDFRTFAERYELDGSKGGGAHMWREVWNETVSQIYRDVLKTEEPKFGRQPKEDPYAELKHAKKYP
ncbi:PEBP-like protein [Amylocystis lapponica]|nr:PEBP-like protein [Amylocystis lapponica]